MHCSAAADACSNLGITSNTPQRLTLAAGWAQTLARSTRQHSKSSCSQAELSCTSEAQLAPPSAALPPTSSSSPIYAVYSFVREQHCGTVWGHHCGYPHQAWLSPMNHRVRPRMRANSSQGDRSCGQGEEREGIPLKQLETAAWLLSADCTVHICKRV